MAVDVDAASWVVAASNSLASAKAKADAVCDGTNDASLLRASLMLGPYRQTEFDDNAYTMAYAAQSVEWLAGDYYLNETLFLPQVVDSTLYAEGTVLHYASTDSSDAVVITGSLRSRFRFGRIISASSGAALAAKDRPYTNPFMPNIMSVISWQGLQKDPPSGSGGYGFWAKKHFVVNKISGTDVRGFGVGIFCDADGEGTIDTNWWWLSYVRGCGTDILVQGGGGSVNSQQWNVNVDASIDGSVAVDTAASDDWWRIIMGDVSRAPTTRSLVVRSAADGNIFEVTPALYFFDGYENRANSARNLFAMLPRNAAPAPPGTNAHLSWRLAEDNDGPTPPTAGQQSSSSSAVRTAKGPKPELASIASRVPKWARKSPSTKDDEVPDDTSRQRRRNHQGPVPYEPAPPAATTPQSAIQEKLRLLSSLLKDQVISADEHRDLRQRVLHKAMEASPRSDPGHQATKDKNSPHRKG